MAGKISADVVYVKSHDRHFRTLCSKGLLQLLCKCNHTSVGAGIPGSVIDYKQYLQRLSFHILLIVAESEA